MARSFLSPELEEDGISELRRLKGDRGLLSIKWNKEAGVGAALGGSLEGRGAAAAETGPALLSTG